MQDHSGIHGSPQLKVDFSDWNLAATLDDSTFAFTPPAGGAVTNGTELVDAVASLQPDVVVADIYMPVMNGLEAAVQIRGHGLRVAIVSVTAHQERELLEAARKTGALQYVTKPSLARDLVPAIRAALEGRPFVSDSPLTMSWLPSQEAASARRCSGEYQPPGGNVSPGSQGAARGALSC